jgi:hypothetical protein
MLVERLKIGAIHWKVEQVENMLAERDLFGECDHWNTRLLIASDQSEASKRDTLFHEAWHACCRQVGIDSEKKYTEEQFISRVGPTLLAMMLENGLDVFFAEDE